MQRVAAVSARVAPLMTPLRKAVPVRPASTASTLYNVVFKRNATYATYIVVSAVILEAIYGTATEAFWNSINNGRTYETVDWSKFKEQE